MTTTDTSMCYAIRLDVSGSTAEELQQKALAEAARFFQAAESRLSLAVFEAEPEVVDSNGHVLGWRASVTVMLAK